MSSIPEIMEEELRDAVDGKNEKALHRFISLLFESMAVKSEVTSELQMVKSDVRLLAETMQQGFMRMDAKFDDMNRRFNYMFAFMTVGFTAITVLMSLYRFLG